MNKVILLLWFYAVGVTTFAQPSYYQGKCIFDGTKVILPLQSSYPSTYSNIVTTIANAIGVNANDIININSQWGSIEPNGDLVYLTNNNYPDKPTGNLNYCEANNVDVIKFTNAGPFNGHDIISYTLANGTIGSVIIEVDAGDIERQLRYIEELEAVRSGLYRNYILMRPLSFKKPQHYLNAQVNMSSISGWQYIDKNSDANQTATTYPDKWGWEPIGNGSLCNGTYYTVNSTVSDFSRPANYTRSASNDHMGGYRGAFNGNGYSISHLYINRVVENAMGVVINGDNYIGLFGYIFQGSIKYLGISNAKIDAGAYAGALCGVLTRGSITSCYASGIITCGGQTGGLIGLTRYDNNNIVKDIWSSTIVNCNVSYTNSATNKGKNIGGVIGMARDIKVQNVLGLIGEGILDGSNISIDDGRGLGGAIGRVFGQTHVENIFAYGDVIGPTFDNRVQTGGVIGMLSGSASNLWAYEGQVVVNPSTNVNNINGVSLNELSTGSWYTSSVGLDFSNGYWCTETLNESLFPTVIGPNGPMGLDEADLIPLSDFEVIFNLNGGTARNNQGIQISGPFQQVAYYGDKIRDPGEEHEDKAAITDVERTGYELIGWYCLYSDNPIKILDPWSFNEAVLVGNEYLVDSLGIPRLRLYAKWACLDCHNGVQNIGDSTLINRLNQELELTSQDWRCDTIKVWQPVIIKSQEVIRVCDYVGVIQLMGVEISLEDGAELIAPQTDFNGTVWPYVHSRECNTCPMDGYRNNNQLIIEYVK